MYRPTSDIRRNLESRLYHVTKAFLKMSFTVHYNCTEISGFMSVLSIRIVSVSRFYLLIFYFEDFSTWICRKCDAKSLFCRKISGWIVIKVLFFFLNENNVSRSVILVTWLTGRYWYVSTILWGEHATLKNWEIHLFDNVNVIHVIAFNYNKCLLRVDRVPRKGDDVYNPKSLATSLTLNRVRLKLPVPERF